MVPAAIDEESLASRHAEITTWSNNCALSCTSVFLVNAFLAGKLSERSKANLVLHFNEYYQTALTIEQLQDMFASVVTLPADRQVIVGSVLRAFVTSEGIVPEEGNMLSNEAFRPIATEFEFNVKFYADVDGEINISGAIPAITIDPGFPLMLKPYYHDSHYDLITDNSEEKVRHNQSAFEESTLYLPIETGREADLKERIRGIVRAYYDEPVRDEAEIEAADPAAGVGAGLGGDAEPLDPELDEVARPVEFEREEPLDAGICEIKRGIDMISENLRKVAANFEATGDDSNAMVVSSLISGLHEASNYFFAKSLEAQQRDIADFSDQVFRLVAKAQGEFPESRGILSWMFQEPAVNQALKRANEMIQTFDARDLEPLRDEEEQAQRIVPPVR